MARGESTLGTRPGRQRGARPSLGVWAAGGRYLYASWRRPAPRRSGSSQTAHPRRVPVAPPPSPRGPARSPGAPGLAGPQPRRPPLGERRLRVPLAATGPPLHGRCPWRPHSPASGQHRCPDTVRSVGREGQREGRSRDTPPRPPMGECCDGGGPAPRGRRAELWSGSGLSSWSGGCHGGWGPPPSSWPGCRSCGGPGGEAGE